MASLWYYMRAGQKLGPVPAQQLAQMARAGELLATDLVWKEGLENWVEAVRLKGLTFQKKAVSPVLPVVTLGPATPATSALSQLRVVAHPRPWFIKPFAIVLAIFGFASLPLGAFFLATSSLILQPRRLGLTFARITAGFWTSAFVTVVPLLVFSAVKEGVPFGDPWRIIVVSVFYAEFVGVMLLVTLSQTCRRFFAQNILACPDCGNPKLKKRFWPDVFRCEECNAVFSLTRQLTDCPCGTPRRRYSWLHYVACIFFPYGLISLLFTLKKCRKCSLPYPPD